MTDKSRNSYTPSMCLLAFAFNCHPDAPLIVTSNRDEFYERPTLPMHWWADSQILAGRDQQAGGTWLGLKCNGRFAAVTNFRDFHENKISQTKPLSRGKLLTDFLSSSDDVHQWADSITARLSDYDGFNLLIYDGVSLLYLNNKGGQRVILEPGVYALSNHALDCPWPKVTHAREQLSQIIEDRKIDAEVLPILLEALSLQKIYPPHLLPNTGVPAEWESLLSSPFIIAEGYGTRAATAIVVSSNGEVHVAEQCFQAGQRRGFNQFNFRISDN
ncbi:MAG: hypothetical protein ACI8YN_000510 [Porticoccaceae bacterium]|jgi:uncharacterized protein with NRDE domain